MAHRFIALMGAAAAAIAVVSPARNLAFAKGFGQRDLQGIWTNATLTPLERPRDLAGKEFFTEAEAAEYEKQGRERNDADRRDSNAEADLAVGYNAAWWDRGTRIVSTRRTSLVVDPRDGRVPPLTPEAQSQAAARAEATRLHPADGPEDGSLADRCIVRGTAVPPMLPAGYNNNYQILQTPEHVVILVEMIHDARIISLDGRPHLAKKIHNWLGDSRGRWEGNTLVVDTTNFTDQTAYRGSSEQLHLVERFTRTADDTMIYQFTVEDPATWAKPWTAEVPWTKTKGPVYEYACHEGNTMISTILRGARVAEEETAQKRAK
jgi:hypothetical protein